MAIPRLPLVLCIWEDANVGGDDAVSLDNVESFHKPTIVHTLGWLLKQDDRGVTIVNEYYDSTFRGRTFVPAKMLLSVTTYNLAKPRKIRHVRSGPPVSSDVAVSLSKP